MVYEFAESLEPLLKDGTVLKPGSHVVNAEQMPDQWFSGENLVGLRWNNEPLNLPSDMQPSLTCVRGKDYPNTPNFECQSIISKLADEVDCGSLIIRKDETSTVYASPDSIASAAGGKSTNISGSFSWSIQLDSQLPSLSCTFYQKTLNKRTLVYRTKFYGNPDIKEVQYHSPKQLMTAAQRPELSPSLPAWHIKAAEEGRLYGISIIFKNNSVGARLCDSVNMIFDNRGIPGMDGQCEDRWKSRDDMFSQLQFGLKKQTGYDRAVWHFINDHDCIITFLKEADIVSILPDIDVQCKHWCEIMRITILHGQFWFYTMQHPYNNEAKSAGMKLHAYSCRSPPPVPFWLVSRFQLTVDKTGICQIEPLFWSRIVHDENDALHSLWSIPNYDLLALVWEIGHVRELVARRQMTAKNQLSIINSEERCISKWSNETWPVTSSCWKDIHLFMEGDSLTRWDILQNWFEKGKKKHSKRIRKHNKKQKATKH